MFAHTYCFNSSLPFSLPLYFFDFIFKYLLGSILITLPEIKVLELKEWHTLKPTNDQRQQSIRALWILQLLVVSFGKKCMVVCLLNKQIRIISYRVIISNYMFTWYCIRPSGVIPSLFSSTRNWTLWNPLAGERASLNSRKSRGSMVSRIVTWSTKI